MDRMASTDNPQRTIRIEASDYRLMNMAAALHESSFQVWALGALQERACKDLESWPDPLKLDPKT